MSLSLSALLEKLLQREDLEQTEAAWLMEQTMSGQLTPVQVAGWLVALRAKGETPVEIAALAGVLREKALPFPQIRRPLLDTCGTGGDRSHLMNVSTLSALTVAAMGVPVAKHGNRSVSSSSGSADLLEKLGYSLAESAENTAKRIEQQNFGFLFAPNFHPAMKHAAAPRKELGIRTIFNMLGPLANPARAEIHLLGVFDSKLLVTFTRVLQQLEVKTALVVASTEGLDEISPMAATNYVLLHEGQYREGLLNPELFQLSNRDLSVLQVTSADDAAAKAKATLAGEFIAGMEAVAVNSAAALYLWDLHQGLTSDSLPNYLTRKIPEVMTFLREQKVLAWLNHWQS